MMAAVESVDSNFGCIFVLIQLFSNMNEWYYRRVGWGGSVVSLAPCDPRVQTLGKSFTRNCSWRFGVKTPTQYQCCSRECL